MKTTIKLFSIAIISLIAFFGGTNFVTAQGNTVINCTSATVSATLNSTGGAPTTVGFEWGTNQSSVDGGAGTKTATQVFSTAPQTFTQVISGLSQNTTYYYRAVFSNTYGSAHGETRSFLTPACASNVSLPTITTNAATSVIQNGAILNGYVVSNGASTNTWFEWGTTQSFGNTTSSVNQGNQSTNFTGLLTGLSTNTTYYYRAVAQNTQGTVQGSTMSFTTTSQNIGSQSQPSITTQSATNISSDYAVLNAYVDTNNTSDTVRWFEWGINSYVGNQNQTTHYNQGVSAGTFSASLSGLTQNVTYYYRAVAQNAQGTVYGSTYSFTTNTNGNNNNNNCGSWGWGNNCGNSVVLVSTRNADASNDFAVLNGYVDANGTNDTTRWFEWGGSQSLGNSTQKLAHGNVASNFSATLTGLVPNTTYYYRAAGRNSLGTVYGNIMSFTTSGQINTNINNGSAPTGTTLLATEITGVTAKLNGLVFTSSGQSSNSWFEWGTNVNLGNKTQTVSVGALPVVKHSDIITGLAEGQTYYYRIVAENPYGKVYGSVNSLVSNRNSVTPVTPIIVDDEPRTVVVRPATVVVRGGTSQALVSLSIEGGEEMIGRGEKRTYHVVWKNESAQTLSNVVLRIEFPKTINVDSSTRGTFSSVDNSVIIDLKSIAPRAGGDVFVFATTTRDLKAGELLVVTANMIYTGVNGLQNDAIAYITHRPESTQSAQGANVLNAGEFVPTTLFEWVILMILVLILVLLGNHLYGRFSGESH